MTPSPYILTICDSVTKVETLRTSLFNNITVLDTYSMELGNLSKIFLVREHLLTRSDLADDTVVILLDAYDVFCIRYKLASLVADFERTNQDLIVGAETIFCHHRSETLPFFLDRYMQYSARYLNSGFILGYKWAYLLMLDHIADNFDAEYSNRHNNCDQRAISSFMYKNDSLGMIRMDLDSNQHFCHTHTYHDNPLRLEQINSYFVHVTWLALEIQARAYEQIASHFVPRLRTGRSHQGPLC